MTSRRSEVHRPIKQFTLKINLEDSDSAKLKSLSQLLPNSRLVSDVVLSVTVDTENPETAVNLLKQTRELVKTVYGPDKPTPHRHRQDKG